MFESDAFAKREKALEDEFFYRVDENLRAELRRSIARERSRETLAEATGLTDPELLDALFESGFQTTTLAALALVPAIFVAWADDNADQLECETVMKEAKKRGMNEDGLALQMLESWLKKRPPRSLWETWKRYAHCVGESLSDSASGVLSSEVLRIATAVAAASGGVFGFGKISKEEQEVLDEIKEAMEFRF